MDDLLEKAYSYSKLIEHADVRKRFIGAVKKSLPRGLNVGKINQDSPGAHTFPDICSRLEGIGRVGNPEEPQADHIEKLAKSIYTARRVIMPVDLVVVLDGTEEEKKVNAISGWHRIEATKKSRDRVLKEAFEDYNKCFSKRKEESNKKILELIKNLTSSLKAENDYRAKASIQDRIKRERKKLKYPDYSGVREIVFPTIPCVLTFLKSEDKERLLQDKNKVEENLIHHHATELNKQKYAIDRALILEDLKAFYRDEAGRISQDELAGLSGLNRSTVQNLLSLAELPSQILDLAKPNQDKIKESNLYKHAQKFTSVAKAVKKRIDEKYEIKGTRSRKTKMTDDIRKEENAEIAKQQAPIVVLIEEALQREIAGKEPDVPWINSKRRSEAPNKDYSSYIESHNRALIKSLEESGKKSFTLAEIKKVMSGKALPPIGKSTKGTKKRK